MPPQFANKPRLRDLVNKQQGVWPETTSDDWFGGFQPTEEVSMYDHPLLKEPGSMATMLEVFTEAHEAERTRGRNEGRLQGQARVIARQATLRFGTETARRLSRLLAGVTDLDRLDGVAEAVIECGGGAEFLARVEALLEADPH